MNDQHSINPQNYSPKNDEKKDSVEDNPPTIEQFDFNKYIYNDQEEEHTKEKLNYELN